MNLIYELDEDPPQGFDRKEFLYKIESGEQIEQSYTVRD